MEMSRSEFAELVIKEWNGSPEVQAEFGGNFNRYRAFREAEENGRVKIIPGKKEQ